MSVDWFKNFLARKPSQREAVLAALAVAAQPSKPGELASILHNAGARSAKKWNISQVLDRLEASAVKTEEGWELTDIGRSQLNDIGFPVFGANVREIQSNLRSLYSKSLNSRTIDYLNEVILAFENRMHRSAIVMSWVAAIHAVKSEIARNYLSDLNKEQAKRDHKWRVAKSVDDLSRVKEYDLLQLSVAVGFLTKDVKETLEGCLKRRNSCGHPNPLLLDDNTVAHHIETLILNVFNQDWAAV